ncbi:hypothetical protein C4J97_2115 [Pseudomonas orientalis]|nr:hypothetical protein C4J97_2115 [Pseudomonas orientalis]
MAVGQSTFIYLTHRYRGQAPSHICLHFNSGMGDICQDHGYRMHEVFGLNAIKLWEGACPRWRWVSQHLQ